MNLRHTLPANRDAAAAAQGTRYWMSEFERVHLMTAARIRGERVHNRSET